MSQSVHKNHLYRTLPILLFILVELSGILLYFGLENHQQRIFDLASVEIEEDLAEKLKQPPQVMENILSLYEASEFVSRSEFRSFVGATDDEKFNAKTYGSRGIGFVKYVQNPDLVDFVQTMRSDANLQQEGIPSFTLHPSGERPEYYIVQYAEPRASYAALGLDLRAEPIRRKAAEKARDTGKLAIASPVTLKTNDSVGESFILLQPIYKKGFPTATKAQRQASLEGFGVVTYDYGLFFADIINHYVEHHGLALKLYDLDPESGEKVLVLNTVDSSEQIEESLSQNLRNESLVKIGDKTFVMEYTATTDFGLSRWLLATPYIVILFGAFVATLLFTFMRREYLAHLLAISEKERCKQVVQDAQGAVSPKELDAIKNQLADTKGHIYEKNEEIKRLNDLLIAREVRMKELKDQIKEQSDEGEGN
jgi:CHASE1-domain containing sensor protein